MKRTQPDDFAFDLDDDSAADGDGIDLIGDYSPDGPDIPHTETYEEQVKHESARIPSEMDEQRKLAQAHIDASNDFDFFTCIVFTSMAQRDAFLDATRWDAFGKRYIDGLALAKKLGVQLPASAYRPPKREGPDPSLAPFALSLDDLSI